MRPDKDAGGEYTFTGFLRWPLPPNFGAQKAGDLNAGGVQVACRNDVVEVVFSAIPIRARE